ncbi:heterokaryon incompatibility protein-domain-containing protein [Paraphoma chrysanthemicola]|nr:heterokaryon incompatibility protein-domain-containing protein [Paraphoma chrysanthemicola]
MQRDTHLTFGEIYGTREAMLEDIEKVIDIALYERDDGVPLQLRFITPLHLTDDWYTDESYCDYRITRPEEHTPDLQYVTVSYCWKHSQSLEGLPELPEYRIHGAFNSSNLPGRARRLRCPEIVFHRAVQFAKHVGCAYIWIDQECIDQDDSLDIEGHLQVMHRVYSESCWTAAVLSLNAPDQHKLDALKHWVELGLDNSQDETDAAHILLALHTLEEWSLDPWFWRTWAFQEKNCARSLYLLMAFSEDHIMSDYKLATPSGVYFSTVVDLCIHFHNFANPLVRTTTFLSKGLGISDQGERIKSTDIFQAVWRGFHASSSSLKHRIGKLLGCYVTNRRMTYSEATAIAFKMMGSCSNLVVADRVSIMGNVLPWYKWRLHSNRLNSSDYSLSGCLFTLRLVNFCGQDPKQLRQRVWSEVSGGLMECKVTDWSCHVGKEIPTMLRQRGQAASIATSSIVDGYEHGKLT